MEMMCFKKISIISFYLFIFVSCFYPETKHDNKLYAFENIILEPFSHQYGYVNKDLELVIEPKYEIARDFLDGLGIVKYDGKWHLIDKSGKIIQTFDYYDVSLYSEGYTLFRENGSYGFIDINDNILIDGLEYANIFLEGYAPIEDGNGANFIDKNGDRLSNINYFFTTHFYNGSARIKTDGKKWGIIDVKGNLIAEAIYNSIEKYSDGFCLAHITKNNQVESFFIDTKGNRKRVPSYEGEEPVFITNFYNGRSFIGTKDVDGNDICRIINKDFETISIIKNQFNEVGDFGEIGLASARIFKDGKRLWGFINTDGDFVIDPIFESVDDFDLNGITKVQKNGLDFGFLDMTGRYVSVQDILDRGIVK